MGLMLPPPRWPAWPHSPMQSGARLRATCLRGQPVPTGPGGAGAPLNRERQRSGIWPVCRLIELNRPLGPSLRSLNTNLHGPSGYCCQASTAAEATLQEETSSHCLTEESHSHDLSLTKPSRQIHQLTH